MKRKKLTRSASEQKELRLKQLKFIHLHRKISRDIIDSGAEFPGESPYWESHKSYKEWAQLHDEIIKVDEQWIMDYLGL